MPTSEKPRKQYQQPKQKNPLHGSGTMTTQEIVQHSAEKYYPDIDWRKVYTWCYQAIQSNEYRMLREHNTLFLYHINGTTADHCYLFTADDTKQIIKAFKNGCKALKTAGFKRIETDVLDPQIIRLARLAKLDVHNELRDGVQHLEVTL
jgi:hypothetical protein